MSRRAASAAIATIDQFCRFCYSRSKSPARTGYADSDFTCKTLDYQSPLATTRHTLPELLDHSQQLIHEARQLSAPQIGKLMGISDKLADLNATRFHDWQPDFTPDNARQAIPAFKGDVYTGLQADTFSEADFDFAQRHLRMLSGLYGVLRPLDLMQPYRLEMGIRLANTKGKDLYQFWGHHH